MNCYGKHLAAFILSLSVLLVGSTCTSAGCLLAFSVVPANGSLPPCCTAHANGTQVDSRHSTPGDGKSDCPLCRHSVLIGKAAEKAGNAVALDFSPAHFLAAFYVPHLAAPQHAVVPSIAQDETPLGIPSTLLALHCALLT